MDDSFGRLGEHFAFYGKNDDKEQNRNQGPFDVFDCFFERDGFAELKRLDGVDFGVDCLGKKFKAGVVATVNHLFQLKDIQ